jgi:hypothetical protein
METSKQRMCHARRWHPPIWLSNFFEAASSFLHLKTCGGNYTY